jgi:hypothetical protein
LTRSSRPLAGLFMLFRKIWVASAGVHRISGSEAKSKPWGFRTAQLNITEKKVKKVKFMCNVSRVKESERERESAE